MKDFIPYNESLELKELGFDEESLGLFSRDKVFVLKWIPNQQECEEYFGGILAPTFSQAFRFFREKYKLYSNIDGYGSETNGEIHYFEYEIYKNQSDRIQNSLVSLSDKSIEYKTYDEAELSCLKKLIQIVKQQKL